jgi:hypothetical protein
MRVAQAFADKFQPNWNFEIDAGALYLLAGKDVPEEIPQHRERNLAITRDQSWRCCELLASAGPTSSLLGMGELKNPTCRGLSSRRLRACLS